MEFRSKVEEEVYNAMKSGKYNIASLNMFEKINEIELTKNVIDHMEYTEELFQEHLYELNELNTQKPGLKEYLLALKAGDILDNQSLEQENSFLLGLYMQTLEETAVDKMIKYAKNNTDLTNETIKDLAHTLLKGTSSKNIEVIRSANRTYVGRYENGERVIDYFPIDYTETDECLNKLAEFYNNLLQGKIYENIFVQPFIIHGLFGALQVFGDGNTRMGRLHQHILLWQLINEKTKFNFDMPPIYVTRSYYPYREEYRKRISNLVTKGDNDAWNEWIQFNLKRLEDQIFNNNENIISLKRSL